MSRPEPERHRPPRKRASTARIFAIAFTVVALLAGAEFYALWRQGRHETPAIVQPLPALPAPEGAIDTPTADAVVGPRLTITGWALDRAGIKAVEVRLGAERFAARLGIARADVAQAKSDFPDNTHAGFEFVGDLSSHPAPPGVDQRMATVVAIATDGREAILGQRRVIVASALERWGDLRQPKTSPFYLLPALSGIPLGGARELDQTYTPYESSTLRVGMRVPLLYLRTTRGKAGDYTFDPRFDIEHRCTTTRRVAEDALASIFDTSSRFNLPLLLTLNGGIWASAACDAPDWDVNDRLAQDPLNCQWNEKNAVMPADALAGLPGSTDAPRLGRSLTFNVYAREVRRYQKRNLQQAARLIVDYMREHPELVVGINLDPDTYLNPFFNERQWYDYNPGTLRQFRHWLAGTGPYAGASEGTPDLSAYRRRKPLSLAEVSALAKRNFMKWDDVDPPRVFSRDPAHPFWKDPWVREWEVFRRHLVALHYEELAQSLVEAGVPRDRIWTSQGFMAPAGDAMPFALTIDSPVKNYDSGGMSVAGSKPPDGHLGAILYGASAVNDIPMENGKSLFATLAAIDPGFGVVEFNTADLRNPAAQPTYASGYRALRDLWNAGAKFVSPMAWNGSNGSNAGKPGYTTYTAWRNTPLEDAARDFLLARYGLAPGSMLWTFGSASHADGDGWTAESGTIALGPGVMTLRPDGNHRIALASPAALALVPERIGRIVAGLPREARVTDIRVYARTAGAQAWEPLFAARGDAIGAVNAGRIVTRTTHARAAPIDQLKIEFAFEGEQSEVPLTRIAILPPP